MSRPSRVLDWTGPSERERLLRDFDEQWASLGRLLYRILELDATHPTPTALLTPDTFVKATVAAAQFGWHPNTIRRWARERKIGSVGSGGSVRVSTADLAAMIATPTARQRPAAAGRSS